MFNHIAIVGLGLIGGSLARDIRRLGLAATITGFGRNPERLKKACDMGIIDTWHTEYNRALHRLTLLSSAPPFG